MKKSLISAAVVASLALGGCATVPTTSQYSATQANRISQVYFGTVIGSRQVVISSGQSGTAGTLAGGAAGGLLGSQIGRGNGSILGAVVGAIGGAMVGSAVEKSHSSTPATEVTIHMDRGPDVVITEKTKDSFPRGERVEIIGYGTNDARIVPMPQ